EKLEAHCIDLFYEAKTKTTTLKGSPDMTATKDKNVIYARELQIQEKTIEGEKKEKKQYQQIAARGPGRVDMHEGTHDKNSLHAFWSDKLTTSRDDGHDLLTLTGAARFEDDEHDQTLQGDILKVWLDDKEPQPAKAKEKPAAKPAEGGTSPA